VTLVPYRRVLRLPGVARLLGFAVLARIPHITAGMVMTLHVVIGLDKGYGAAGLVATVTTVGQALGSPWRGRAVDKVGLRRALVPSVVAEAFVWGAAPFATYRQLLVLAAVAGLLGLPIFTVVRQSLAVLVPVDDQRPAFALDSMGTELTFMIGPALGVFVATQFGTRVALVAVGVTTVVAGLSLIAINPPTRSAPVVAPLDGRDEAGPGSIAAAASGPRMGSGEGAPHERVPRAQWFDARLAAVLAATTGALVVLGGTDVSAVAHLRDTDAIGFTGVVFLAWSISSLLGGLVFGAMRRPVSPFVLLLLMSLFTIPMGLAPGWVGLTLAIFPAGLLCAPVLSATTAAVSRLVPEAARGEAMGWYGSAMTAGIAVGAPMAGWVIDATSSPGGFAVVGFVGTAMAVLGVLVERLRGRSDGVRRESVEADAADVERDVSSLIR